MLFRSTVLHLIGFYTQALFVYILMQHYTIQEAQDCLSAKPHTIKKVWNSLTRYRRLQHKFGSTRKGRVCALVWASLLGGQCGIEFVLTISLSPPFLLRGAPRCWSACSSVGLRSWGPVVGAWTRPSSASTS